MIIIVFLHSNTSRLQTVIRMINNEDDAICSDAK